MNKEVELILKKLKIVSESEEPGAYICDKEHSKILLDYIQQRDNIITELEKYINDIWNSGYEPTGKDITDKLKELKGSATNE